MAYVYILETEIGFYYIGSTTNLSARMKHHVGGHTESTSKFGALKLVFSQEYQTLSEARIIEKRLKKLKRRDYLEKIIKEGIIRMRV